MSVVSLCIFRIEICNTSTGDNKMEHKSGKSKSVQGRRQAKEIKVQTYTNSACSSKDVTLLKSDSNNSNKSKKNIRKVGITNYSNRREDGESCVETGTGTTDNSAKEDQIAFVSGNSFVEVTKGIIHLYKEDDVLTVVDSDLFNCTILCILAVPASMMCHDLLTFTAAWHSNIKHIRIIRDGSINQYMSLIYFRSTESTIEFYNAYNGAPFSSLEPEYICQLVYVSRVEVNNEHLPPAGHTELPTCPVCLERMDESVDGILTILCNHSFHGNCLVKWGDSSCPVCRYCQTPEFVGENKCFECHSSESLWMCLICGYVGCGRYIQGHARKHYTETSHCYSMQLGNNRVWDYAGDNFVHRLLQNKDGKLVEASSEKNSSSGNMDEKLDSVQLEYTYLLTSQLESQRHYYEGKISKLTHELSGVGKSNVQKLMSEKQSAESKLNNALRDKHAQDKKIAQLSTKLSQIQSDLNDEKQMSNSLQLNQAIWQDKLTSLEKEYKEYKISKELELQELKDQLRDIMFYFEAQNKIEQSSDKDDIAGGTIVIQESPSTSSSTSKAHSRTTRRR